MDLSKMKKRVENCKRGDWPSRSANRIVRELMTEVGRLEIELVSLSSSADWVNPSSRPWQATKSRVDPD